ncbi:MAG: spermidine/putrescine ABC transporter substrate-binding protein [Clostridia bacterium]
MKKIFTAFLCVLLMSNAIISASAYEYTYLDMDLDLEYYEKFKDDNISINVYNWGEYISDGSDDSIDVNAEFEELTGITVNYTNFATNEDLYAKLKGGLAQYDVIIPSEYMISRMIDEDMLEKLDFSNIPNFEYIDDDFKNQAYDPDNEYAVPYTWGTIGIIYNTSYIDADDDMATWDALWNEKYTDKILMFSNQRDAFGIAMKKNGFSMNSVSEEEYNIALADLKEQKIVLQAYVMDEIFDKMASGEAWIAPYYAGDAVVMMDMNEDLAFATPVEGTNRFLDAMCIPKGSTQKAAAEMYINFMCEPEIGAANIEYICYSTPNWASYALLDEETQEDEMIYPPDEILEQSEYYITLPDEINLMMDSMWAELLTESTGYSQWVVIAILLILSISSVAINVSRYKRKHRDY